MSNIKEKEFTFEMKISDDNKSNLENNIEESSSDVKHVIDEVKFSINIFHISIRKFQ